MKWNSRSGSLTDPKIVYKSAWPLINEFGASPVAIYDKRLAQAVPGFRNWINKFKFTYPVTAGESLKEIEDFPGHITRLIEITRGLSPQTMSFVAIGGGSVGDFSGLVASLFKRGITLYQVPSTWLAAIDSSHGGKTALNVGSAKNQIGTFYGAEKIFILKPLLLGQPPDRIQDGLGELVKIALIDGGPWSRNFLKVKRPTAEVVWNFLPPAIRSKYKVIKKDPFELQGHRQILNLGHTLGHLFEVLGPYSHGVAVGQGLFFALEWSHHRGLLSASKLEKIRSFLSQNLALHPWPTNHRKLSPKEFHDLILKDKKREESSSLQFIFFKDFGKAIRQRVTLVELAKEAQRQGLLSASLKSASFKN